MSSFQVPVHGLIDYEREDQRIPLVIYTLQSEGTKMSLWLNKDEIRRLIEDFNINDRRQRTALLQMHYNLLATNYEISVAIHKKRIQLFTEKHPNEEVEAIRANFYDLLNKKIYDEPYKFPVVDIPLYKECHLGYVHVVNSMRQNMSQRAFRELCPHRQVLKQYAADRQYFMVDSAYYQPYSFYFNAFPGPGIQSGIGQMLTMHTLFTMVEQNIPIYHDDYYFIEDKYIDKKVVEEVEKNGTLVQQERIIKHLILKVLRRPLTDHPFYQLLNQSHFALVSPYSHLYTRLQLHRKVFDGAIQSIAASRYYYMYNLYNGYTPEEGLLNGFEEST